MQAKFRGLEACPWQTPMAPSKSLGVQVAKDSSLEVMGWLGDSSMGVPWRRGTHQFTGQVSIASCSSSSEWAPADHTSCCHKNLHT